jgi:ubiquinone/menaquinone biosynthesis C-methylase UbiE
MSSIKFTDDFLYKTRERIIPGTVSMQVLSDHYSRYFFAKKYCKDKMVLNVASGCGYGSEVLKENAKEIFNIDIDGELIAYGNYRYGNPSNHFIKMDAQNMAFPSNFFDAIVSFETFEHLPDYKKFIAECHRILKKDGIMILSTPNKIVSSPNSEKPYNKFHFKEWTLPEIESDLKKYFTVDKLFGQNYILSNFIERSPYNQLKNKLNEIIYQFTPGIVFKILKKYFLKYKDIPLKDIKILEESKINKASRKDFLLDKNKSGYLVLVLYLKKING